MGVNFSLLGIDFITMICFMLYKTITFDETAPHSVRSAPARRRRIEPAIHFYRQKKPSFLTGFCSPFSPPRRIEPETHYFE